MDPHGPEALTPEELAIIAKEVTTGRLCRSHRTFRWSTRPRSVTTINHLQLVNGPQVVEVVGGRRDGPRIS
jgi:hypothetical protein